MTERRWRRGTMVAAAVALVALLGGAYGVFAWVSGGGPTPVSIEEVPGDTSRSSGDTTEPAAADLNGTFDGAWTLVPGESFVGYRVREQLVFLPAPNDAVGRTTAVDGSLEISGTEVVATSVTADLTQLESDGSRRDDAIRTNGIQTDLYPTATFELTEPIAFAEQPAGGQVVEVEATGELTLHGVTRAVTFPLEARWDGGQIAVVGSLEIDLADYDIAPPSLGPATVEDHGTIEVQLIFVPASRA